MENMISNIETALKPLERFGMGACSHAVAPAAKSASNRAVATPRPRTGTAVGFAAQLLDPAATGRGRRLQRISATPVYMTRTIAGGEGALGTHPAREPV